MANIQIKLRIPVKDVFVVQPFGVNYFNFYEKMNLLGHSGIDFRTKRGCPVYATHDGKITWAGDNPNDVKNGQPAQYVRLNGDGFYTIYYHLLECKVKRLDRVKAGDLIGLADNTGKMTTGDHLHFELKILEVGEVQRSNGYNGATDPAPYFAYTYNGKEIKNKDWDKPRAYHRYYMDRTAGHEWVIVCNLPVFRKRYKRRAKAEELNALVYGGWDYASVQNPAMFPLWSQLTINEYKQGEKPFK